MPFKSSAMPAWRGTAAALGLGLAVTALGTLPARAATNHVVINEVYGGGGNTGSTWTNDFVELHNPTGSAVDLSGYQLAYYSASGNLGSTCTLSGTIAAGGDYLVQEAKGSAGTTPLPTPDATCTAAMSATAGSVQLTAPDGTVVDLVGFGTATKVEGTAAPAPSSTTSISRTNYADTDNNAADFTVGTPSPQNSSSPVVAPDPSSSPSSAPSGSASATPTPDPSTSATPSASTTASAVTIADIQGTGASTPLAGQTVTTRGVVTASYPTGGFNGFYMQTPGSGGTPKTAGQASDGIFVYTGTAPTATVGQCYDVTGVPAEYNGLTQITKPTLVAATDCAPVKATDLATLPATDADKEPYEGMLVQPLGTYTITNNYDLNTYGQIGLAVGNDPLWTPTDRVAPSEAAAFEAEQVKKYITLDDGSSWNYMSNTTAKNSPLPYLSQDEPMRTGSHTTFSKPVILDYRFQWNFQPTGQIVGSTDSDDPVTTENTRPTTAPAVGGDLKLGAMNVLNYFTDLGQDEAGCAAYTDIHGTPVSSKNCTVRGAYTPAALADQQAKIVAALALQNADVVGLMEVENSSQFGHDRDASLKTLVDALNAKVGAGTYAYVPSPSVLPATQDVIRTAIIYKPAKVTPVGPSIILDAPSFTNARQPLAQRFTSNATGSEFVFVANHFKSKGSGVDDGTGQGLSEPTREAEATDLVTWEKQLFGDEAAFMVGDFNAYTEETPVKTIEAAGFTDLVRKFSPQDTSYQFGGRLGSLDHAFANAAGLALVTGAADLNINADESVAMQYSRRLYNVVDFYQPTPYAASDHDPVLFGITDAAPKMPTVTSYQSCTAFGFKATDYRAGDQLRITGHWNGQAQTTTVALTDAGWYSGSKPTWTDATAVVVRDGKVLDGTSTAITQAADCTAVVHGTATTKGFGFTVGNPQPGDQLRVTYTVKGVSQTVTVDAAKGFSLQSNQWSTASATVVRAGEPLPSTTVNLVRPKK